MEIFKGESIITFFDRFKTDMDCLEYLAEKKLSLGFICEKCKHNKCTIRKKNLARDCNKCHHIESPTAGTLFHKVKFGLRKSFGFVFEMSATTKSISANQMSKRYEVRYITAWLFMQKVRDAMKSSESKPMKGDVIVDEFVSLIKPPNNIYSPFTIQVHGIYPRDTVNAKSFAQVFPEIQKRLQNRVVVAHNESFDRNVLSKSMALYGLDYDKLNIGSRWECTVKIYKAKAENECQLNIT